VNVSDALKSSRTRRIAEGFSWPEAPRWCDGQLWISDVHNFRLVSVTSDGDIVSQIDIPQRPSGFDFIESGRILLATGLTKQLLLVSLSSGATEIAADLNGTVKGALNDLVVSETGWAFVGDTGFLFNVDEPKECGTIIAFHPEHGHRIAAENVFFPNGMVITPDGKTLYVSETFGKRITAFDLDDDGGSLSNRRVFAEVPGSPDGLALDAEGGLWVPLLFEDRFVRVDADGKIVDQILFEGRRAISCITGGPGRATLFMGVAKLDNTDPDNPVRHGEVYEMSLNTPGAGRP
jgi:sugar lactone lactonase YvrE